MILRKSIILKGQLKFFIVFISAYIFSQAYLLGYIQDLFKIKKQHLGPFRQHKMVVF